MFGILTLDLFLLGIAALFAASIIRGASFVPTTEDRVEKMVKISKVQPGEKVIDLGSGDGRVLIAFAKAGALTHGYEINPLLVLLSLWRIRRAGVYGRAFVHWGDFWKVDFSTYEVITVFGIGYIMQKLARKLRKELKPNARVISNAFPFPDWEPAWEEDKLYMYIRQKEDD